MFSEIRIEPEQKLKERPELMETKGCGMAVVFIVDLIKLTTLNGRCKGANGTSRRIWNQFKSIISDDHQEHMRLVGEISTWVDTIGRRYFTVELTTYRTSGRPATWYSVCFNSDGSEREQNKVVQSF